MALWNGKVQDKKFKSFKTNIWSFYQNILQKMRRRNSSQMIPQIKQLEKCQNEYYTDNLNLISFSSHTSLQLLMFPIALLKRSLWSYWKWQTFEGKIWPFFMTCKNRDLFFHNTFASYVCWEENFFQEYIELELKTFFIIFERLFEWQKQNITIINFKLAFITCK